MADVTAYGPAVALADDSYNRAGFLDSKASAYAWLDAVDTSAMTAEEADALGDLRAAWDNFFGWDDQVVEWVRPGTRAGLVTAMDSINGGGGGAGYGIVLAAARADT